MNLHKHVKDKYGPRWSFWHGPGDQYGWMIIIVLILMALSSCRAHALTLTWDWTPDADNPEANIVFRLYKVTSLSANPHWLLFDTIPGDARQYTTPADGPSGFFIMTAYNTVTGEESIPNQ